MQINKKADVIKSDKLLDGVCVFLTNHTEKQGRGFKVKPQTIIKAYREKTKIEDVFKNVKSFLKLRPFFVNTEAHVKAVYTICILAYFINRYLANQRKAIGEKDFLNSKELYAPFKDIDIATLEDPTAANVLQKSSQGARELPKPCWTNSHCPCCHGPLKMRTPMRVVTEKKLVSTCYHYFYALSPEHGLYIPHKCASILPLIILDIRVIPILDHGSVSWPIIC